MRAEYERAKLDGLNWQALAITDAQTEIKLLIKNSVMQHKTIAAIDKGVKAIISELSDTLESEELISRCKTTLPMFATKFYYQFLAVAVLINNPQYKANQIASREELMTLEKAAKAYNRGIANNEFTRVYHGKVNTAFRRLVDTEAKEDYSSNVNLRNIAEMTVRHDKQIKTLDNLKNMGVQLVWIEPHENCSVRCEPWQGRLYSLNGTYGKISGESYQPIEKAMDVYYTTKAGKTYRNGCISGFNCRHKLTPYADNNKPAMIPANVVNRERRIEAIQRKMERGIREQKEIYLLNRGIDDGVALQARKNAIMLNKRYINFSMKNNVPFYRERARLLTTERDEIMNRK